MSGRSDFEPTNPSTTRYPKETNIVNVHHGSNVVIRSYIADSFATMKGVAAVEGALDVEWRIPRPVGRVWAQWLDFNSWQGRYGYHYVGAVEEGNIIYLTDPS